MDRYNTLLHTDTNYLQTAKHHQQRIVRGFRLRVNLVIDESLLLLFTSAVYLQLGIMDLGLTDKIRIMPNKDIPDATYMYTV